MCGNENQGDITAFGHPMEGNVVLLLIGDSFLAL